MRGGSTKDEDEDEESTMMLKLRVMKIVLNFQINKVPSVLCLYLVNMSYVFNSVHIYFDMLYSLYL